MNDYLETNRRHWQACVPVHRQATDYRVKELVTNPKALSRPVEFDRHGIGELANKRLIHLQCHIGTDSLSLARLGAQVLGVDFSEAAIATARELAAQAGVRAEFRVCELHETPALVRERFDIVYVSVGAVCWLPNIRRWAGVVSELLEPSGILYLRDVHPMLQTLEHEDGRLVVRYPYFELEQPTRWEQAATYTLDPIPPEHATSYDWNHGLGETVSALLEQGLTLEWLREHRQAEWQAFPSMRQEEDGWYRLPEPARAHVPMTFSLRAVKGPLRAAAAR